MRTISATGSFSAVVAAVPTMRKIDVTPPSPRARKGHVCGRRHRASHVRARDSHLSHSDRTHLSFFSLSFFFKCSPRGRVGRRPPWTQTATDARPKQWASATIPHRAAPKFWAILSAPVRRHGRRPPLKTRPPFFSSARAFGPPENSQCKRCAEFGISAWYVV